MGSIIGHRRDYNGVGALRGQQHIPENIDPSTPQPPPPSPLPPPWRVTFCMAMYYNCKERLRATTWKGTLKKNKTNKQKTQTIIPNCKYLEYESVCHSNESYLR